MLDTKKKKKSLPLLQNPWAVGLICRGGAPNILEMRCSATAHRPGPVPAPTELREVGAALPRESGQRQRPLVTLTPRGQALIRASLQP